MRTLSSTRRRASLVLAWIVFPLLIGACGDGDGGNDLATLGGLIETTTFNLPVGEQRRVDRDLILRTTDGITLDGDLILDLGVRVALITDGELVVRGSIAPAPVEATDEPDPDLPHRPLPPPDSAPREGGTPGALVLAGRSVQLGPDEAATRLNRQDGRTFQLKGTAAGESTYVCTTGGPGTVTVSTILVGATGPSAQAAGEPGGPGGNIEIGTDAAIAVARELAARVPAAPASVQLGRLTFLQGGTGGSGLADPTGHREGDELVADGATAGGSGGDVIIKAGRIDLSGGFENGAVEGGPGGRGGGVFGLHAPDGTAVGEAGVSIRFTTGDGGKGGDVTLLGALFPVGDAGRRVRLGQPGAAGSATVSPGDGGPGGDGGSVLGFLGLPGQPGTANVSNPRPAAAVNRYFTPFVGVLNGGNGGAAIVAGAPGGRGGFCAVRLRDNRAPAAPLSLHLGHAFNGGPGANGCGTGDGGADRSGGEGGDVRRIENNVSLFAGTMLLRGWLGGIPFVEDAEGNFPAITEAVVMHGGAGGDGAPPGAGGLGGFDNRGNRIGTDGADGKPCDGTGTGGDTEVGRYFERLREGTLTPVPLKFAAALNDEHQVVGIDVAGQTVALFDADTGAIMPVPGQFQPLDVSNNGDVVGFTINPTTSRQQGVYVPAGGSPRVLPADHPPGASLLAISPNGAFIAGFGSNAQQRTQAARFAAADPRLALLALPEGTSHSQATDVADDGTTVGYAGDLANLPVLWLPEQPPRRLPFPTWLDSAQGEAVAATGDAAWGSGRTPSGWSQAVGWDLAGDGPHDLHTLLGNALPEGAELRSSTALCGNRHHAGGFGQTAAGRVFAALWQSPFLATSAAADLNDFFPQVGQVLLEVVDMAADGSLLIAAESATAGEHDFFFLEPR